MKTGILKFGLAVITVLLLISFISRGIRKNVSEQVNHLFSGNHNNMKEKIQSLLPEEGDYMSTKMIDDIQFEMIPQPAEKRIYLLTGNQNPTEVDLKDANGIICYELRISHSSGKDVLELPNIRKKEDRVTYFATDFGNHIKMIVDRDTLPCTMCHFERNFSYAPYQSFQIGFPYNKEWKNKPHHLIIQDDYFGFGELHLENTYQ
jgi:hypothetical protein